jgi:hypothetical protein
MIAVNVAATTDATRPSTKEVTMSLLRSFGSTAATPEMSTTDTNVASIPMRATIESYDYPK